MSWIWWQSNEQHSMLLTQFQNFNVDVRRQIVTSQDVFTGTRSRLLQLRKQKTSKSGWFDLQCFEDWFWSVIPCSIWTLFCPCRPHWFSLVNNVRRNNFTISIAAKLGKLREGNTTRAVTTWRKNPVQSLDGKFASYAQKINKRSK